tara:strand:+ start:1283 stop:1510 length:228 start_codon:yes stop_codon:yes gene_type:complete
MKIGDFVQWRDQTNYPGLCGIVTKMGTHTAGMKARNEPPDIFVHWTAFPKDYGIGAGWEKVKDVELLSTGEIKCQ